jgi:hypothetical protein
MKVSQKTAVLLVGAAFLFGVGLMIPFEATITRILGVAFLLAFIIGGVFLIAAPAFLSADEEERPGGGVDGTT